MKATPRDSALLLGAFGALAYAASLMTHEALGHGSYCVAVGGQNTILTAWSETCRFSGAPQPGIKAAGPGVQFGAGLLAWLVLHRVPSSAARLRCLLWLYMTFNLLVSSSYVAFSGFTGMGDAAELAAPHHAPLVWHVGLILLGSVAYFLSMRATAYELKRFAGRDNEMRRLLRLVWIPYISTGVFACFTAAMNQILAHRVTSEVAMASPALNRMMGPLGMAVVSSFGAGLGMFGLPAMQRRIKLKDCSPAFYLQLSGVWGVAAGAILVLFVRYAGPGR